MGPALGTRLSITGLSVNENNNDESAGWIPLIDIDNRTKSCVLLGDLHVMDDFDTNLAGTVNAAKLHDNMAESKKFEPKTVTNAPPNAGLEDGTTRTRTGMGLQWKSGPSTKSMPLLLTPTRAIPKGNAGNGHCRLLVDTNEAGRIVLPILHVRDGTSRKFSPLKTTL